VLNDQGSTPNRRNAGTFFSLHNHGRPALGQTQPPIQFPVGDFAPGIKQIGVEIDHSPPSNVKIMKIDALSYTCTPPICLLGMMLS